MHLCARLLVRTFRFILALAITSGVGYVITSGDQVDWTDKQVEHCFHRISFSAFHPLLLISAGFSLLVERDAMYIVCVVKFCPPCLR